MSVADILERLAQNAGRARLARGALVGNLVAGAAAVPGQIIVDRDEQRIRQAVLDRQRAQDARLTAQDARQAAADARQQAELQTATEYKAAVKAGLVAAAGDGSDPTQFDARAAFEAVKQLGHPEAIRDVIATHRDMLPKFTAGAPGTVMRDENAQVVPGSEIPEKPPAPSAAVFAAAATDPTKTPDERAAAKAALDAVQQTPGAAETARHNKEIERIAAMTAGRTEAAQRETARHNRAIEATAAAANPFAVMAPANGAAATQAAKLGPVGTAGAQGPTGEDFLATLPPGIASEVKAYAEGKRPFPSGMSYAKLQPMIQLVGQYDPTFDAANYNARNKARTDLTSPSGTGGKTISALNTAIQHAGKLSDLIETLDNYEMPAANAVVNPLRTAMGSTKVTNYNTVAPQLAKEIERVWRGAGGTAGEIQELIQTIGANKGKQQQREALQQFVELAQGKLDAVQTQRDNVLGQKAGADIPVLFKQNQAIVERIAQRAGVKPSAEAPTPTPGALPPPPAGRIRIVGPNGQSGTILATDPIPSGWRQP